MKKININTSKSSIDAGRFYNANNKFSLHREMW